MLITSSWDDGHPSDLKLCDLLLKYNVKGTFYVPIKNPENIVMSSSELKELSNFFEIGGHTYNHVYLDKLNPLDTIDEIQSGKLELENIIQKNISSFCFPGGKFKRNDLNIVNELGFKFARTTKFFNTNTPINGNYMNTTVQIFEHRSKAYLFNLLKQRNFKKVVSNICSINLNYLQIIENDLSRFDNLKNSCIHFWGHSWELDKFNLWYDLEELLKILTNEQHNVYLDNNELFDLIKLS